MMTRNCTSMYERSGDSLFRGVCREIVVRTRGRCNVLAFADGHELRYSRSVNIQFASAPVVDLVESDGIQGGTLQAETEERDNLNLIPVQDNMISMTHYRRRNQQTYP